MRIRMAFLSCTVLAMAALLAPTAALATGSSSCSTFNPVVEIKKGPCPVTSGSPADCAASGAYTGIKYKITEASPDHAATLVTENNIPLVPSGFQKYDPGLGDPVTGLGKYSKHERALKVNPNHAATGEFWVVVPGAKSAIPSSIALKKGSCIKSFLIDGLGFDAPVAPVTEILTHGECSVEFTMNAVTGTVLKAKFTSDSAVGCTSPSISTTEPGVIDPAPVTTLEVFQDGESLGSAVNFGSGFFQSGTTSCTTKIVGGKVYTYGKPCP